ncbi:ABC transporter permease [Paenibacillus sp. UMB4589-SE434]|uniref:ABC transporter permease n=1 Tax=Paenibacillus sp. UMB4589-SE434 TaxID=3046314 RepID=UPI00254D0B8E|nr:ABC transporter permease [Paenibacillus sp. UMB4589-SE434]MDK8181102.1 ABC transporter permease [Paenibacillus sp. UMB4589-SE434]
MFHAGFWEAMLKSVEIGLLYAIMAFGVYLTFRILDFPDLTVDGSFTTGAGIAALSISSGMNPFVATMLACIGGGLAGILTGLIHTKGKVNALLSGILMMIALHSINLRIMGRSNITLVNTETLLSPLSEGFKYEFVLVMGVAAIVIKLLLDLFLKTEIGLALRATGDNARMIRSLGVRTDSTIIIGVGLSNAMVALAGALIAQYQGFADIQLGVGMIVIGLASVIIGEAVFGHRTIVRATFAVLLGAILYRLIVAVALQMELNSTDLKLLTAVIVIIALTLPMIRRAVRQRADSRRRAVELIQSGGDV